MEPTTLAVISIIVMSLLTLLIASFVAFVQLSIFIFLLKRTFTPANLMLFLRSRDPKTKMSLMEMILDSIRKSCAGASGGRPRKENGMMPAAGGIEKIMAALQMLQAMGQMNRNQQAPPPKS